ncbi:ATP-binding protein [Acinetobacter boissieri]|uniref:histidine kinase n=1 Tax=Acinetobacter boissieri TaxID=1219383 RepID=A0A1G6JXJ4_9GAMM|nr:ATP-binding protein [Acinetobacter boissieri]SDC23457.1 two-component system, OmpR family, sensor histidine kinase RstB [Acinetobacter boissieri]
MLKHSIFLRIYATVVGMVILVTLFAYFSTQVINYHRAQQYRESLTDGISYVITQGVERQTTTQQKKDWISDASDLLDLPLHLIDANQIELSSAEQKRIDNQQAVVRYDAQAMVANIYMGLTTDSKHYLLLTVNKIGERQMKALPIFILDYLIYYPGQEQQHLKTIQQHFSYPIDMRSVLDLGLDSEQLGRLRQDQSILLYRDSATMRGTTISIVSPLLNNPSEVLVIGPVPMFNWMPFELAAGITLLSLFLLSIGVYFAIFPLQRKVKQTIAALNQIKSGDLSARLNADGYDEMSSLSSSYNDMANHIERLIEAQRELMRAVSHELRTPVARIRFGMEMLADEDDYEFRQSQVEMIDKDIEALNTLIDEIMTYAKLEQGAPSLDIETIEIASVLSQVLTETRALKTGKDVILNAPSVDVVAEAERRYLHRVVQNLVGNAVRHCHSQVCISGGIQEDGLAFICVEDDGEGIAEADRERVFEAFARLDDSRTRASGGYGLGLSIVSRIAFWFGGTVTVDQSPSLKGARFTMTWPAVRPTVHSKNSK